MQGVGGMCVWGWGVCVYVVELFFISEPIVSKFAYLIGITR